MAAQILQQIISLSFRKRQFISQTVSLLMEMVLNDEFGIEGESIRFEDFELIIYDRWGHQVFGSTRPDRKWDGVNMDGDILPAGVYSL